MALVIEREIRIFFPKIFNNGLFKFFWFFVVQVIVLIAWVYFRSDTLTNANQFIFNIVSLNFLTEVKSEIFYGIIYILPLIIYHLRVYILEKFSYMFISKMEKIFISGIALYFILTMYATAKVSFIYFQF